MLSQKSPKFYKDPLTRLPQGSKISNKVKDLKHIETDENDKWEYRTNDDMKSKKSRASFIEQPDLYQKLLSHESKSQHTHTEISYQDNQQNQFANNYQPMQTFNNYQEYNQETQLNNNNFGQEFNNKYNANNYNQETLKNNQNKTHQYSINNDINSREFYQSLEKSQNYGSLSNQQQEESMNNGREYMQQQEESMNNGRESNQYQENSQNYGSQSNQKQEESMNNSRESNQYQKESQNYGRESNQYLEKSQNYGRESTLQQEKTSKDFEEIQQQLHLQIENNQKLMIENQQWRDNYSQLKELYLKLDNNQLIKQIDISNPIQYPEESQTILKKELDNRLIKAQIEILKKNSYLNQEQNEQNLQQIQQNHEIQIKQLNDQIINQIQQIQQLQTYISTNQTGEEQMSHQKSEQTVSIISTKYSEVNQKSYLKNKYDPKSMNKNYASSKNLKNQYQYVTSNINNYQKPQKPENLHKTLVTSQSFKWNQFKNKNILSPKSQDSNYKLKKQLDN